MPVRFRDERTGDVIELPPPNILGMAVVTFNGRVVERVLYSDESNSVTMEDGRVFYGDAFAKYLVNSLLTGAYR